MARPTKFTELTTETLFLDRIRSHDMDEPDALKEASGHHLSNEAFLLDSPDPYLISRKNLSAIKARIEGYNKEQEQKEAEEQRRRKFINGLLGI